MNIKIFPVWALFNDRGKRLRKEPDYDVRHGPAKWITANKAIRHAYFQYAIYPRKRDAKYSKHGGALKKMFLLSEEDFNELVSLKERK